MRDRRQLYALAPLAVGAIVCGVVVAGVALTLRPTFVARSAAAVGAPGLDAWRALFALPGLGASVALTLATGVGATLASLVLACCIGAAAITPRRRTWMLGVAATVAAIPPAALAAGLAELAWSAGARSAQTWPGEWLPGVIQGAVMLTVALGLKIAPFLAAMTLIAMTRIDVDRHAAVARTLGYSRAEAFVKLILPQIYRSLRLPVCAALAWSLSGVAVAVFDDTVRPAPLALIAWRDLAAGSAAQRAEGAAAAGVVLALVAVAMLLYFAFEQIAARAGRAWLRRGGRGRTTSVLASIGLAISTAGLAVVVAALAALAVAADTASGGMGAGAIASAASPALGAVTTLAIAVVATLAAVAVAIACLEAEDRARRHGAWPVLLWAPWIVPQIAFVPGIAWILSDVGARAPFAAALVSQLVFVLPCAALAVVSPWRSLDPRYAQCAGALRAAPRRVLARVKLPLVARPIAVACALSVAVSAGLFVPVRLTVPDRIATLETEVTASAPAPISREAALEAALLALVPAGLVAAALRLRGRPIAAPAAWQPAAG